MCDSCKDNITAGVRINLKQPDAPFRNTKNYAAQLNLQFGKEAIWAHDEFDGPIALFDKDSDGLLHAAWLAFCHHQGLALSPDVFYQLIMAGVSRHVNANAERLRNLLVLHDGQKVLEVEENGVIDPDAFGRRNLRKDEMEELERCLEEFQVQIAASATKLGAELTGMKLSTSGPTERVAASIVVMSAMKSYFQYVMITRCGMAYIHLMGSKDDWEKLVNLVRKIAAIDDFCNLWAGQMETCLQQFVDAFEGKQDTAFWNSMYKYEGPRGSGCPKVSGWISKFFPYVKAQGYGAEGTVPNEHLAATGYAYIPNAFPATMSDAPVLWKHLPSMRRIKMKLTAGLLRVAVQGNTVIPQVGWLISPNAAGAASAVEKLTNANVHLSE
jgi:hypothetical protein